ncbi:hypothetical protein [Salimicrobium halophilum]|uniref:Phage uncharacterized protein (Putative large terminase), C-terminal domain-containing protein n=1 Tax=Salimicrobium halophilum TaxID=86666 RepID=A0A1G8WE63_9BACI|nr:hypothetical protein [Salimicrobium halophilum]SDJ76417.1 phage uncharacterized protein (putative large terminase), C-terminal domain-containing protein [Salimicrobium halophilum]
MSQSTVEINTKENRKTLYTYLAKSYGSDKAKELMQKHRRNMFGPGGLAHALGKRSMEFFCLYFLQDIFVPKEDNEARDLAPVHYDMWGEMEDLMIHDSHDAQAFVVPRGIGKTTAGDMALSVWAHCYAISHYTLVAGKTEQDAVEFVKETRHALEENPYIRYAFGQLIDTNKGIVNKLELELTNHTKVQAISSTSSLRGKKYNGHRPSIIIADDYQGKRDVITQEARDSKYNTWQQDAKYAGDKAVFRDGKKIKMATKFIVLGTILHRDCFVSRISNNKAYKVMKERVIEDDVDELFNSGHWKEFKRIYFNASDPHAEENAYEYYYQHEEDMQYDVLWPDKFDCLELALDYYEDPISFKQEMQNDASKIGEKAFHHMTRKPREVIEQQHFEKTMLLCDPAVETAAHNDSTALLVGGLTSNNFRWCREGRLVKVPFDEYIDNVIKLLEKYEDITHIWVEKNTYNGADVREIEKRIEADASLSARRIQIINERQNKNKEAKIRAISAKVDNGSIIFAEEDEDFREQVMSYEGEGYSLHDDAPDVTAEFDRLIDEIEDVPQVEFMDSAVLFGR